MVGFRCTEQTFISCFFLQDGTYAFEVKAVFATFSRLNMFTSHHGVSSSRYLMHKRWQLFFPLCYAQKIMQSLDVENACTNNCCSLCLGPTIMT